MTGRFFLNVVFCFCTINAFRSSDNYDKIFLSRHFVEAHVGETLDALVDKLVKENIAVCLTVTPMFGKGGLSSIMARRHVPIQYAVAHNPHIKYNFASVGSHKLGEIYEKHNTSMFMDIFKQRVGSGCKLDGGDGRIMQEDEICLTGTNASVGALAFERNVTIFDGDTLTVCRLPLGIRDPLFDFRATRATFMQAYWKNDYTKPHPRFLESVRRKNRLVVSVHFRNGDSSRDHLLANVIRYVPAKAYYDLLSVLARLPKNCAHVFFLSEIANDKQVKLAKTWLGKKSEHRVPIHIIDADICDGPCGLTMLTHADVLIGANSGFSILAAVLAKDSTVVSFVNWTYPGEDSYHIGLWDDRHHQTGHPIADGSQEFEIFLRRKLSLKCALLD